MKVLIEGEIAFFVPSTHYALSNELFNPVCSPKVQLGRTNGATIALNDTSPLIHRRGEQVTFF